MSINISIVSDKLRIVTDVTSKLEIFVNEDFKWIENDARTGLISSTLPTEYFVLKYGGWLVMVNRNKVIQDFSEAVEDLPATSVRWYNASNNELLDTGYYYTCVNENLKVNSVYGKLELIGDTLYVNAYITIGQIGGN